MSTLIHVVLGANISLSDLHFLTRTKYVSFVIKFVQHLERSENNMFRGGGVSMKSSQESIFT